VALLSTLATNALQTILTGETGLNMSIEQVGGIAGEPLAMLSESQIVRQYIGVEAAEKSPVRYPMAYVYCEKVTNTLREKFRAISAKCRLVVEVRVSQDRVEGLEAQAQRYADAVCDVLNHHRGDWGNGLYYGGGYEATFAAVRTGGRNYLQTAKITVDVDICKE